MGLMEEADYPPWPSEPLPAKRDTDWLHFYGPDGERGAIPITVEGCRQGGQRSLQPWAIVDNGDGTATVSPSIHQVGSWHSPNPVTFRLVGELPDPKR
jgi:hypothetical protein